MQMEHETAGIRLWCAFYDEIADEALLRRYRRLLSDAERVQEGRFHFADDRRRYLVTRALLRTVLSQHVVSEIAPEQWTFVSNAYGRPQVANNHLSARDLSFNISHTRQLILLGIARGRELGVDVENPHHRESLLDIADRFFAAGEVAALRSLPVEQQQQRFFEYWTLKESYIKARGMGLSIPLDQFGFQFPHPERIELEVDPRLQDVAARWRFWQIWLRDDYLAAVCAQRAPGEPQGFTVCETMPLVWEKPLLYRPFRASI